MVEIKFGDKVKYFDCEYESATPGYFLIEKRGIVIAIHKNGKELEIRRDDGRISHKHRKQCRKLVKKILCEYCEGLGLGAPYVFIGNDYLATKCQGCNGSGKVRHYE